MEKYNDKCACKFKESVYASVHEKQKDVQECVLGTRIKENIKVNRENS